MSKRRQRRMERRIERNLNDSRNYEVTFKIPTTSDPFFTFSFEVDPRDCDIFLMRQVLDAYYPDRKRPNELLDAKVSAERATPLTPTFYVVRFSNDDSNLYAAEWNLSVWWTTLQYREEYRNGNYGPAASLRKRIVALINDAPTKTPNQTIVNFALHTLEPRHITVIPVILLVAPYKNFRSLELQRIIDDVITKGRHVGAIIGLCGWPIPTILHCIDVVIWDPIDSNNLTKLNINTHWLKLLTKIQAEAIRNAYQVHGQWIAYRQRTKSLDLLNVQRMVNARSLVPIPTIEPLLQQETTSTIHEFRQCLLPYTSVIQREIETHVTHIRPIIDIIISYLEPVLHRYQFRGQLVDRKPAPTTFSIIRRVFCKYDAALVSMTIVSRIDTPSVSVTPAWFPAVQAMFNSSEPPTIIELYDHQKPMT